MKKSATTVPPGFFCDNDKAGHYKLFAKRQSAKPLSAFEMPLDLIPCRRRRDLFTTTLFALLSHVLRDFLYEWDSYANIGSTCCTQQVSLLRLRRPKSG